MNTSNRIGQYHETARELEHFFQHQGQRRDNNISIGSRGIQSVELASTMRPSWNRNELTSTKVERETSIAASGADEYNQLSGNRMYTALITEIDQH